MATRRYSNGPARGPRRDPVVRDPWDSPAMVIGSMAHQAIGRVIDDPGDWRGCDNRRRAWQLAGSFTRQDPSIGRDWRAKCLIAGAVVTYARSLLPPDDWRLLGVELALGDAGRVDIGWKTGSGEVVYDEIKLATARGRSSWTGAWTRQAATYAAYGALTYADRFAGVRLILLGAARASRLVRADGSSCPLPGTDLWFGASRPMAGGDR